MISHSNQIRYVMCLFYLKEILRISTFSIILWLSPFFPVVLSIKVSSAIFQTTKFYLPTVTNDLKEESSIELDLYPGDNDIDISFTTVPSFVRWDIFLSEMPGAQIEIKGIIESLSHVSRQISAEQFYSPHELLLSDSPLRLSTSANATDPQIYLNLSQYQGFFNAARIVICVSMGVVVLIIMKYIELLVAKK